MKKVSAIKSRVKKYKFLGFILCSSTLFGVYHWGNTQKQSIQAVSVESSPLQVEVPPVLKKQIEIPRQYTEYKAEITIHEGYFEGIENIKYVHEFKTSTDQILIKLPLNNQIENQIENQTHQVAEEEVSREYQSEISSIGKDYMYITKAFVGGEEVKFEQEGENAYLLLNSELHTGEEITIGLEFQGNIKYLNEGNAHAYLLMPQMSVFREGSGFVLGEKNEEQDGPIEIGDYALTILLKDGRVPICTGALTEKSIMPTGEVKYSYEAKRVRGIGVYIGNPLGKYQLEGLTEPDIFIYTNRLLDNPAISNSLEQAFHYYGELLGTYPYERFVLIDEPGKEGIDIYPGLSVLDVQSFYNNQECIYQLLGKQWISYIIAHHPDKRISLDQGLLAYLAKRKVHTLDTLEKYFIQNKEENKEEADELSNELYSMEFFFKVEKAIGTQEWEKFLREYYKEKAFKLSSYDEFMGVLLQSTPLNSIRVLEQSEKPLRESEEMLQ